MPYFRKSWYHLPNVLMIALAMVNLASCATMRDAKPHSDWMPTKFDVSDWGGFTGYQITLEKGKFVYRVLNGDRVEVKTLDYPEEGQWNEFWRKLNNIGLWNWEREYRITDPAVIVDGGGKWVINIEHGKHTITSTGENVYPDAQNVAKSNQAPAKSRPYLEFEAAIKSLFGIENLYGQ